MISVDIYNDVNCAHIASFEIEFNWQYEELIDFETALEFQGIKFFEITTYQQED